MHTEKNALIALALAAALASQPPASLAQSLSAPASPPVDLEAMAKRLMQAQGDALRPAALGAPALYVFVSLSMPRESLAVLADQAAAAGAALVLRGLVDRSMAKTTHALRDAVGEAKARLIIDPRLYDRFGVSVAPTFVLATPAAAATVNCGQSDRSAQCAQSPSDEFAKIAGDVSLDYALRQIAAGQASLAPLTKTYLDRLSRRR